MTGLRSNFISTLNSTPTPKMVRASAVGLLGLHPAHSTGSGDAPRSGMPEIRPEQPFKQTRLSGRKQLLSDYLVAHKARLSPGSAQPAPFRLTPGMALFGNQLDSVPFDLLKQNTSSFGQPRSRGLPSCHRLRNGFFRNLARRIEKASSVLLLD